MRRLIAFPHARRPGTAQSRDWFPSPRLKRRAARRLRFRASRDLPGRATSGLTQLLLRQAWTSVYAWPRGQERAVAFPSATRGHCLSLNSACRARRVCAPFSRSHRGPGNLQVVCRYLQKGLSRFLVLHPFGDRARTSLARFRYRVAMSASASIR